ncbi:MAG TPA: ABC transporter permease [Candidatus Angelobacter sp.]|nr:ABC transporter permease [Candidatus Angelobacter sp.]
MNTQSDAVPRSSLESQAAAPTVISPARRMYWSVRRELWENRSIYIAPLAAAAVVLVAFLFGIIAMPGHRMRTVMTLSPARQRAQIVLPYDVAAGLIMATAFFVGLYYCLEALHSERRDRSILFWKSLPVSDLTTVLSKASIPFGLVLFSFVLTFVTQLIMLLLSSAVVLADGLSVATLWTHVSLLQSSLTLIYHLVTVHVLWYAPIYAWLLLVSAWARRATFLWAVLPPLAILAIEKIAFNTSHFGAWLAYRLGGPEAFNISSSPGLSAQAGGVSMTGMTSLDPEKFFSTPGLWFGLIVAAAFLFAAAQLRRYRGPI